MMLFSFIVQIKKLDLCYNKLKDDGVKSIKDAINNIEELDLGNNEITCVGARYLADGLKHNDKVTSYFTISKCNPSSSSHIK